MIGYLLLLLLLLLAMVMSVSPQRCYRRHWEVF